MRHDYCCPECGWVLRDQERTVAVGGQGDLPVCFNCDLPMEWVPQARFDLRSDGSTGVGTFAKFSTFDGRNQPVTIDSLHKLRQVERESEQLAKDGLGQQVVFRAWANNRGNKLDPTLGTIPPSERPSEEAKRKFGLRGGARPLDESGAADRSFGPGVTEANTSALKEP